MMKLFFPRRRMMKGLFIALVMVGAGLVTPAEARSSVSIGMHYSIQMGHRPPPVCYQCYEAPVIVLPPPCYYYYPEGYYVVQRYPHCCHHCGSRHRAYRGY